MAAHQERTKNIQHNCPGEKVYATIMQDIAMNTHCVFAGVIEMIKRNLVLGLAVMVCCVSFFSVESSAMEKKKKEADDKINRMVRDTLVSAKAGIDQAIQIYDRGVQTRKETAAYATAFIACKAEMDRCTQEPMKKAFSCNKGACDAAQIGAALAKCQAAYNACIEKIP